MTNLALFWVHSNMNCMVHHQHVFPLTFSMSDGLFFCLDAPVCGIQEGSSTVVNVEKHEAVSLLCVLDASPSQVDFTWTFRSARDREPLDIARSQFSGQGLLSRLTYTPKTDLDYGTVVCKASNLVGDSTRPCVYQIRPAGEKTG